MKKIRSREECIRAVVLKCGYYIDREQVDDATERVLTGDEFNEYAKDYHFAYDVIDTLRAK